MELLTDEQPVTVEPLKVADRCDECQAQAFVRVSKQIDGKPHDLLLCGHDYAKNELTFAASGWAVQDERHRINQKPASGSNYVEE